jgi:very-short-patch-repair endonuclease
MDYFVVDFYCHEIMLALEVDGSSHNIPGRAEYDARRQKRLKSFGVRFIRIPDRDVRYNMDGVLRYIKWKVDALVELDRVKIERHR